MTPLQTYLAGLESVEAKSATLARVGEIVKQKEL